MGFEVGSLSELEGRIGFVLLSAATRFPRIGPFSDDHQKNLGLAFSSIERAMTPVERRGSDPETIARLKSLLADSLGAFQRGDVGTGTILLHEFSETLFPSRSADGGS